MDIVAFTDGSCFKNGSPDAEGSWAIVWPDGQFQPMAQKMLQTPGIPVTNNRAEYMAAIIAIETVDEIDPDYSQSLIIYSDSMLLINTVTKWMAKWEKNSWKKSGAEIKNLDLVKRLFELTTKRNVSWNHVKAHSGKKDYFSVWNDAVDKLAQEVNKHE